jgi:hypothetical protein
MNTMGLQYPLPNRDTINLDLPTFTLDVNQVALRPPAKLSSDYQGLLRLEWNYFEPYSVELCVTPQTSLEIAQGAPLSELGSVAYQRYLKSELYKSRPPQATLNLLIPEANELWTDMRHNLFPTVVDEHLAPGQIADVNQIFWHTVSSGSIAINSVFVTLDGNFLNHAEDFQFRYGVSITTPNDAWASSESEYSLIIPTDTQLNELWNSQQELFLRIQRAS